MTAAAGGGLDGSLEIKLEGRLEDVRGVVFDVQRMSLHDGPGMRTNVFLKGCPLRCGWCANPESQSVPPQLALHAANCIDCGHFPEACTLCWGANATTSARGRLPWTKTATDARVAFCPTGALHWMGAWRTAGDVMAEVRRDRPFYGAAGGLTLTGGEPSMQPHMCAALLRLAKQEGIATAMETCGHSQWEIYARLLPWVDLFLYDVKHIDPAVHQRHTGMDNTLILANLVQLVELGAAVRVRIPLIPGFNAEPAAVAAIAAAVRALPGLVAGVDLLPYHTLGKAKYAALGQPYPWEGHARLSPDEIAACVAAVRAYDLPVTVGG